MPIFSWRLVSKKINEKIKTGMSIRKSPLEIHSDTFKLQFRPLVQRQHSGLILIPFLVLAQSSG